MFVPNEAFPTAGDPPKTPCEIQLYPINSVTSFHTITITTTTFTNIFMHCKFPKSKSNSTF
jgi:hypothetical protein